MKKSTLHSLPQYQLNADLAQDFFCKAGKAIDKDDYDRAIHFATATIDQIQQSLLVTTLCHRAYAFAMKGKFEKAIQDAEKAVSLNPKSVTGYILLGECYIMQGKQPKMIQTLKTVLDSGILDDKERELFQSRISLGESSSLKTFDPVAKLPNELVDLVFSELSQESKYACLSVSKAWYRTILQSSMAWTTLTLMDESAINQITGILPHIVSYVEELGMDTKYQHIWSEYLNSATEDLNFQKLQRLCLTVNDESHTLRTATFAFSNARNTLTSVEMNICFGQTLFQLADVLSMFHNVNRLTYTTDVEDSLSDFFGNFGQLEAHNSLLDLSINVYRTEREAIEALLKRCQQLRRLVLQGRIADDVLDAINTRCPNLQILGFNSTRAITKLADLNVADGKPGLRQIYTEEGSFGVSPFHLLPLLQKNMQTLNVLLLNFNMSRTQLLNGGPYFEHSEHAYNDLKLDNLEYLLFYTDPNYAIDSIMLRSICACHSLRFFATVGSPNLSAIAKHLMTSPPIRHLELSHTEEEVSADTSLMQLFKYYASGSKDEVNPYTICLQNSKSITDAVLDAVADVKSVKRLALWNLVNVSEEGVNAVLKRVGNRATYVNLSEMVQVTNNHLITLGSMHHLEEVKLQELPCITDHGLISLIDHAVALKRLTLTTCPLISRSCIDYAKQKVKHVIEWDQVDYVDES